MYILWIVLAAAFLVVELGTVTLVSLWFVVGALAAMAAALLNAAFWLQVLIFALVSLAMLLLLRPFLRKFVDPHKIPTNVDAMIGKTALVTEAVDNLREQGAIRFNGLIWTARSTDGNPIPAGEEVVIETVEGVKAMVKTK